MFERVISLIAPHSCLGCNREGTLMCDECRSGLPVAIERCYHCHALSVKGRTCNACRRKSSLFAVRSVAAYQGLAKDAVWKLKFEGGRAVARQLAGGMKVHLEQQGKNEPVIVHVPTATSRVRRRGYDQALLLARQLSLATGVPRYSLLARSGHSKQVGASRRNRQAQLGTAFRVRAPHLAAGSHIVLVDDVITTGATLEACAQVLREAGARRVEAVTFAQA